MTQKFNYQGYTICVTFRSDNALSITASFNMTGQNFINDMAQLGKIKKDTVIAALGRKSEKNLWCTFRTVDSEPRKLIISFVIKFDFLPQFSEDIILQQIQVKGQVLNKISSVQLQSDIEQIEKVLDSIRQKGTITIQQKSTSVNKRTAITEFDLIEGKYLLQLSGILNNTTSPADTIEFLLEQEGKEEVKLKQKTHSQHAYGYPFFISHQIDSKGGKFKIVASNSLNGTAALSNEIITLIPIVGM